MSKSSLELQKWLYRFGIIVVIWVAISFIYSPILEVLKAAFVSDGKISLEAASGLAKSNRVYTAITNTLLVTIFSIFTVNVVGIFQVAALEYISIRGQRLLKIAYAMPLIFVSIVAATGYDFTYGRTGVVTKAIQSVYPSLPDDWFSGLFAVVFAHTFLFTSYHYLFLRAAFRRVDFSVIEAAKSLGASNYRAFVSVVLPLLLPTIFATSLLIAYKSLSSFSIPSVVGGRDFDMASELILTLNSLRRADMAAMLSIGLGLAIIACILVMQWVEKRGSYVGGAKIPVPIQPIKIGNPLANAGVHALAYVIAALQTVPVLLVVAFSFAPAKSILTDVFPSSFSLGNYITVLQGGQAFDPLKNSIAMGICAVALGLAVSIFVVILTDKHRDNKAVTALDLSFMLPWLLPMPLIAIGLIMAFATPNILLGGATLLGTFWILPIGYAIVVTPLMIRFLRAAFWSIDPALGEAGRTLGASPLVVFLKITLPAVFPVIIVVAGMNINTILSEYTVSAFLFNVNNKPLSIALFEGSRSANPEQAAINLVYMTLIMAFSFFVIILADKYGLGKGPIRK
jgi:iron(III) transport system permease protein|tara:strand:- start:949 stop:2655 length:1707 start_codon:yes stop_codon:yes gene_type:complete